MRAIIQVEVDTDQVPGWGYDPQDYVELIQRNLNEQIGHYNPVVKLINPPSTPQSIHASRTKTATAIYDLPKPDYGHVFDVSEFRSYVEDGSFIDYDGFGHPAKKIDGVTKMASNVINPSDHENTIPNDAEYIVWFNR